MGPLCWDVPLSATHVAVDSDGEVYAFSELPRINHGATGWYGGELSAFLGFAELQGENWRDCCWPVSDSIKSDEALYDPNEEIWP